MSVISSVGPLLAVPTIPQIEVARAGAYAEKSISLA